MHVLVVFLFGAAALMAQTGEPLQPAPAGKLVDVGGRILHWSDPVSLPQNFREMSDDLHILMRNSGEMAPFILVGHSGGGELVRRTAENLNDVQPPAKSGASAPQPTPLPARVEKIEPPYDKLSLEDQRFRLWAQSHGKVAASGTNAEVESVQQLGAAHERGDALFGGKPLVVISRATGGYRPIRGIVSQEQADLMERERIEHNRDLLRLSRNSKAMVADKSGHDIHLDQPELVIESIRTIRDAIRSHSHLK